MGLRVLTDEKLLQLLKANNEQAFKEICFCCRHRLATPKTADKPAPTIFLRIGRNVIPFTSLTCKVICKPLSKTVSLITWKGNAEKLTDKPITHNQ